jgi:DNA-binding transcriptional MerR regulator
MTYRVSEVARIANVTVRTLHHYEEVGLLVPSRSEASYRLYTEKDLLRLQQILLWRELGFALEEIRRILDEPGFELREALLIQRNELSRRAGRVAEMIRSVDAALESLQGGKEIEMKDLFSGFDSTGYETEAKERWGDTEAYKESSRRTKGYSREDWTRMKRELDAIFAELVVKMHGGSKASDPDVRELAEQHRLHIDRWFYPCSPSAHRALGEMYVSDERFTATIDAHAPGLARFLAEAIRAGE